MKDSGSVVDYVRNLFLGQYGEAMDDFAAKGAARRFEFWFCPVYTTDTFAIVAAVGVFSFVDDYAGM